MNVSLLVRYKEILKYIILIDEPTFHDLISWIDELNSILLINSYSDSLEIKTIVQMKKLTLQLEELSMQKTNDLYFQKNLY